MKKLLKTRASRITCILLAACMAIGLIVGAAAFVRSIQRGYPLKITSSFIAFTLNGNSYLNEVGSTEMLLTKGEQCDLILHVGLQANANAYVSYRIRFEVDNEAVSEAATDALTNAIEVYRFNGHQYEYLCQLGEVGDKVNDEPKYVYEGELVTDFEQDLYYRLVYSPETSAEYDSIAKNGKFTLRAYADEMSFVTTSNQTYIYVNDLDSFKAAVTDAESVGKTIILNSNITLDESIESAGKLSINLNGYNLNANGNTVTINAGAEGGNPDYHCQLLSGSRISFDENQQPITVRGSILNGRVTLPTDLSFIDPLLVEQVNYTLPDPILTLFTEEVQKRAALFAGGKIFNYGEDVSFLFEDLEYLLGDFDGVPFGDGPISLIPYDESYLEDGFVKICYDGEKFVIDASSNAVTSRYTYQMTFKKGDASKSASGIITLQGQSAYAIAETIADSMPTVIDHSYLLKDYDTNTGAQLEWLVYDELDGTLFNKYGIYRSIGLQNLKKSIDENGGDYYTNFPVDIYLKVSKESDSCTYRIPNVVIRPFTAQELTEIAYNDLPMAVGERNPYRFADYLSTNPALGHYTVEVEFPSEGENDPSKYVELSYDENGFPVLTLKKGVDTNYIGTTKVKLTFKYENDEEYSFTRTVRLLGDAKLITAYDVSTALQSEFWSNSYVEGRNYEFTSHSVLAPNVNTGMGLEQIPVFVDYEVASPSAKEFISVTYDFYPVERSKMNDFFAYFTYDAENDRYVFAKKDENGEFPEAQYYERLAVVEVLPGRVSYIDSDIAIVNAVLYTLNTEGENANQLYYSVGTKDGKSVSGVPDTMEIDGRTVKAYHELASNTISYLYYPLELEIQGIITNSAEGVEDYNLYSYLLLMYDGVYSGTEDGILTSKEAQATWEEVIANLARKGRSEILLQPGDLPSGWVANSYFTAESSSSNQIYTKYFMQDSAKHTPYVLLEDFLEAAKPFSSTKKVIGSYATLYSSARIQNNGALYVLRSTETVFPGNDYNYYKGGTWGKLTYVNGEVQAISDKNLVSGYLWDFIKLETDGNGDPIFPDDYYLDGINVNTAKYLPGVYLIYFQSNSASVGTGDTCYNRYLNVNGSFIHANTTNQSGQTLANNPSIIGPFWYQETNTHSYLNLEDVAISSLKGIEYFPNIKGLSLKNSGVSDLSPLENLLYLQYLDLSAEEAGINTVTNLSSLKYLDQLEVLLLQNTNVTTLNDIRYLRSLETLNITGTTVSDLSAITDMKALRHFTLRKNGLENDYDDMYALAVATLNAGESGLQIQNGSSPVFVSDIQLAVSAVMEELEDFNRVNNMLYLPLKYNFGGETYDLKWFCSSELLSIDNQSGTDFAGYTIQAPLFDTPITISVRISDSDTTYYVPSRTFQVTLEAGTDNPTKYIYNYQTGGYSPIEDVIDNPVLRNLIFSTFNDVNDTVGYGGSTPGFVISMEELQNYRKKDILLDWSNQGLTDFSGIEYLYPLFAQEDLFLKFDLSGNDVEDLSPLTELPLNVLILGGKEYDLSQLCATDENGHLKLTTLRALDVHECVNIQKEASLEYLYKLYLANQNVYIFKDSAPDTYFCDASIAWNPYDELVDKALHGVDSVFAFSQKGDQVNIFGNDERVFHFSFYGETIDFHEKSGELFFHPTSNCFTYNNGTVTYSTLNAWEESAMLKVILTANDGHSGWSVVVGTGNIAPYTPIEISITHDWYVQLIALDPGKFIYVYDTETGKSQPISDLFASYDIAKVVYQWIYRNNGLNGSAVSSLEAMISGADNRYYLDQDTGIYYIKKGFLKRCTTSLSNNPVVGKRISGEELTLGLELLGTTKITFARDADLGDGSHLVNLTDISCSVSSTDLSTLKVPLPNLQNFTTNGYSAFSASEEAMALLTGLTELHLGSSTQNQVETITDFSFLLGLIHEGKSNLRTLEIRNYVGANATIVLPNEQLNTTNWGYVYRLYCAAEENGITPDYKLNYGGSTHAITREDNILYCEGVIVYIDNGEQDNLHINTEDTYTEVDAYPFVTYFMEDMGLKINDGYWLDHPVYDLASGSKLTLPATTFNDWFGIEYPNGDKFRGYEIEWKLMQSTGTLNQFQSTTYTEGAEITLTDDQYAVLVGTVKCEGQPSYSFLYHFIVGDGDGLYSEVKDRTLRAWLFTHCATIDGNTPTDLTTIDLAAKLNKKGDAFEAIFSKDILKGLQTRGLAAACLPQDTFEDYISKLDGFADVMRACGMDQTVTKVDISNQPILSIEELSCLTNLQNLSANSTPITLEGYQVPDTLQTLLLRDTRCLRLEDLNKLAGKSITKLDLYGSGVQARYEVVEKLLALQTIQSAPQKITLAWNDGTASEVTRAELESFQSVLNGTEFQGYAGGFELASIANPPVISGCTVAMPENSYNLLLNFEIAPSVATVLTVRANTEPQLFCYYPATCVKEGSSIGYIGSDDTTPASGFDTELLGYLYTNSVLYKVDDHHLVRSTVTSVSINENIGIKQIPTTDIDGITVTVSNNTLAGANPQPGLYTPKTPGRKLHAGTTISADDKDEFADLVYAYPQVLDPANGTTTYKTLPRDLAYSGDNYLVEIDLPKTIWFAGKAYTVEIVFTESVGSCTFVDTNGSSTMELAFDDSIEEGSTESGKYDILLHPIDEGASFEAKNYIFNVFRLGGGTIEDQDNFLIEVRFDPATMVAYMVDSDNQVTVSAKLSEEPKKLYLGADGVYHTHASATDTGWIYYVNASTFIQSGRMRSYIYWLSEFNGGDNKNYRPFEGGTKGTLFAAVKDGENRYGKVLLNEYALRLVDFRQAMIKGFGVTSINGVQIFANMKKLLLFHNAVSDITPIRSLHLESFHYVNSQKENNFLITDFTPLIEGSADTIREFGYNGYGNAYATDLSFLTGFPQLERVLFGVRPYSTFADSDPVGNAFSYMKSLPFQYVLSSLYNRGVPVYICDQFEYVQDGNFTLDKAKFYTWTEYYAPDILSTKAPLSNFNSALTVDLYPIVPRSYDLKASEMLDQLGSALNPSKNAVYSQFSDGYLYTILRKEIRENNATVYLPATLNYNGRLYFINWRKITENWKEINYVIMSANGTERSHVNYENYVLSMDFYNLQKAGLEQAYAKITFDVGNAQTISACDYTRISCNIEVDGTYYQRMISLKFKEGDES